MSEKSDRSSSDLFLLRLWAREKGEIEEPLANRIDVPGGNSAWQGRLLHIISGEAIAFDDWNSLRQALEGALLRPLEGVTDGRRRTTDDGRQ